MQNSAFQTLVDILLVEDNPAHVYIMQRVLEQSRLRKTLHTVKSGEEALRFLRREPPYEQAPRPKLILLDLYLPKMSGLDVLKTLNQDEALRSIPVIMLTNSEAEEDVLAAYDERARAYITKPADTGAFETVIQVIESFWLNTAQLPAD
ncbi:MAG: response regulator [Rhodothermales bacterium]